MTKLAINYRKVFAVLKRGEHVGSARWKNDGRKWICNVQGISGGMLIRVTVWLDDKNEDCIVRNVSLES